MLRIEPRRDSAAVVVGARSLAQALNHAEQLLEQTWHRRRQPNHRRASRAARTEPTTSPHDVSATLDGPRGRVWQPRRSGAIAARLPPGPRDPKRSAQGCPNVMQRYAAKTCAGNARQAINFLVVPRPR